MADNLILVDTSILIEYYRRTDKSKSVWINLIHEGYESATAISVITQYELYSGATQSQINFWDTIISTILVIPFDESCVDTAVKLNSSLKKKRKQIDIADLFIAATAVNLHLPIATLNKKHFERIDALTLVE
jgi:predicted nucleic acid-binding protein